MSADDHSGAPLLTEASFSAWRAAPDADRAAMLCASATTDELPTRRALFLELARQIRATWPEDVGPLLTVARMYIVLSALPEAQSTLVKATQVAPDDARVFALLGQVLLRLGDARSAVQAFAQATTHGLSGPATQLLYDRARHFVGMQEEHGERAVAEAVVREFDPRKKESRPPEAALGGSDPPGARRSPGKIAPQTLIGMPPWEEPPPKMPSSIPSPAEIDERATEGRRAADRVDTQPSRRRVTPTTSPPTAHSADTTRYAVIQPEPRALRQQKPRGQRTPVGGDPDTAPGYRDYGLERPMPARPIATRSPLADPGEGDGGASQQDVFDRPTVPAPHDEPDPSAGPKKDGIGRPSAASTDSDRPSSQSIKTPAATPMAMSASARVVTPANRTTPGDAPARAIPSPPALGDDVRRLPSPPPSPVPPGLDAARPRSSSSQGSRRLRQGVIAGVIAVLLVGGVQTGRWLERSEASRVSSGMLAEATAALHAGRPRGFVDAEAALGRARQAAPSSVNVALAFAKARTFRAIDGDDSAAAPLAEAIAEARRLDASDLDVAPAELVLFALTRTTGKVDELLARHDGARHKTLAENAFYELAAGVALERRGDARAIERYQAAVRADRSLFPAEVRLVRALLLLGDAAEGRRRVRALAADRPESTVLGSLATRVAGPDAHAAPSPPPGPPPGDEDLPRTLRSIAKALALGRGTESAGHSAAFAAAIGATDAPHVAVLCGDVALEGGEVPSAEFAAQRALDLAPEFGPGLGLSARAALARGELDRARDAAERMQGREGAVLRAMIAYERGDADQALEAARAVVPPPDPEGALQAALLRLRGVALPPSRLEKLARLADPWAQLVAVDSMLDAGDTERARDVIDRWKEAPRSPLHAFRLARAMRHEGHLDDARRLLDVAAPSGATLVERALLAGELRPERQSVLGALDKSGIPERHFLFAYLRARQGVLDKAERIVSALDLPQPDAPRSLRLAAVLALGELSNDRRGRSLARGLLEQYPDNLDVVRAAVGYGLLPKTRLSSLGKAGRR